MLSELYFESIYDTRNVTLKRELEENFELNKYRLNDEMVYNFAKLNVYHPDNMKNVFQMDIFVNLLTDVVGCFSYLYILVEDRNNTLDRCSRILTYSKISDSQSCTYSYCELNRFEFLNMTHKNFPIGWCIYRCSSSDTMLIQIEFFSNASPVTIAEIAVIGKE